MEDEERVLPIFACNLHTLVVTGAALVIAFGVMWAAMRLFVALMEASPAAAVALVVALVGFGIYVGRGDNN